MQQRFRIKSYNLSTLKCWLFVCFFLTIGDNLFAQTDSSNVLNTDIDSVSVDSIQTATDLKSKVKYEAVDSIVYDLENEKVYMYGKAHIIYEDIDL
ncbi:MAG: hypothetical protein RLZZ94_533, partial [Bacteroidota bacterium]